MSWRKGNVNSDIQICGGGCLDTQREGMNSTEKSDQSLISVRPIMTHR